MTTPNPDAPIGVFDSGVGGLSVLRCVRAQMPEESVLYVADQAHVPYGPRSLEQVRAFSEGITRFFIDRGAKIIVVACNSASAAALTHLRTVFPDVPFVGMEPAVKPAVGKTQTGVVGVLATPATFQGALFASVVERFAAGVTLLQDTCPGLVERIEAGDLDGDETRAILRSALEPMLAQGIDTVVLACTHYPFVIPLIQEIVGGNVRVIDPAPAVARQALRLLEANGMRRRDDGRRQTEYFTSGDPSHLASLLTRLLQVEGQATGLAWLSDERIVEQAFPSTSAAQSVGRLG
ncbi:MAG: glutamate racemase [Chloroflexota bacterium]